MISKVQEPAKKPAIYMHRIDNMIDKQGASAPIDSVCGQEQNHCSIQMSVSR